MRLALLSDIHGNIRGLDACLADLHAQGGADTIVAAGDLCMDGPRPREVLERLEEIGAVAVRGNTDREIGDLDVAWDDPDDRDEFAWYRERLGAPWVRRLLELPFSRTFGDGPGGLLVVHANPCSDDEHLRPDASDATLERFTAGVAQRTIAFGHLHVPYVRVWRDFTFVDVASAGLPKDGDPRVGYTILERRDCGWSVRQRRVAFDVDAVARDLEACGVPRLAKRLTVLRRHAYKNLAGLV